MGLFLHIIARAPVTTGSSYNRLQRSLVVLPAVEHTEDGYLFDLRVYGERDHRTLAVIGHANTGPDVIATRTALWERGEKQKLAIALV